MQISRSDAGRARLVPMVHLGPESTEATMKTDLQLKHDVEAELEWEPAVTASRIGVEVKDGVVTLAGHLASLAEKIAAEQATRRVGGVRALVVELEVRLPGEDV